MGEVGFGLWSETKPMQPDVAWGLSLENAATSDGSGGSFGLVIWS
jgi:hypothetical protein